MNRTKRYPGIYLITNVINKKVYVGYSRSCLVRMQNHRNRLRNNIHKNSHLQNAWKTYGSSAFSYNIIEHLSIELTNKQFEQVETKWVLHFNSHLSEFGYNNCLPGSIPLRRENENITGANRQFTDYICVDINTEEIIECNGPVKVNELTNIPVNKVGELSSYWEKLNDGIAHRGRKKSKNGWIIVKKEYYDSEFDYINYKKSIQHIGNNYVNIS